MPMLPRSDHGDVVDAAVAADVDAAIEDEALVRDAIRLIDARSDGGDEVAAQLVVAEIAESLGLHVEVHEEDLGLLRGVPDYPGEEVQRDRLLTVEASSSPAPTGGPRLCLCGHVDVVPADEAAWSSAPFTARYRDGVLIGRGAADMKAGLVASVHAMAAVSRVAPGLGAATTVHAVAAEEDGGLGAFAALRRDADFQACLIPEPTAGEVVCATAGALTWRITLHGRAAHASARLEGASALDGFVRLYPRLQQLESTLNADPVHPAMRHSPLPYPLSVGRVVAGDWASTVPDRAEVEGRVGVPLGRDVQDVRVLFESAVRAADLGPPAAEVSWTGGQFAPAETPVDHPFVRLVCRCAHAVTGVPAEPTGVSYGTDLRHYRARGIPTVLFGPGRIQSAHATDESIEVADLVRHARTTARVILAFAESASIS